MIEHSLEMRLRLECALYFEQHPDAEESAERLAGLMRQSLELTVQALSSLCALRILEEKKAFGSSLYRYVTPSEHTVTGI